MKYISTSKTTSSDLHTPVSMFYKLRQRYSELLLLESSDYSSKEDSLSFLVFDFIEGMEVNNGQFSVTKNGNADVNKVNEFVKQFEDYLGSFDIQHETVVSSQYNGLFGFTSFDAVEYFDKNLYHLKKSVHKTPQIKYGLYRFIIVIEHVSDTMHIIENIEEGKESEMDAILTFLTSARVSTYDFKKDSEVETNMSDDDFKKMVATCKSHCQRGDVFQIVPSRRFAQKFKGDEFNVYRKLRSINPSPYLFYFDYGNFTIFGSSPEAQMIVKNRVAEIHPIAGTIKRTGDIEADNASMQELSDNPKENAEHIMLVDLARNDLSKNTINVHVSKFRQIQQFSHLYHLVSIVKGTLKSEASSYRIFADTFPAGTLSGAPKYMAINLIDQMEPTKRGFYGGGLGAIFFNGNFNHAIMIRSFCAYDNTLYLQSGAGVVIDSTEEGELQEVNNKLAALRKALIEADQSTNS
jgi:anthranilate synthase component I